MQRSDYNFAPLSSDQYEAIITAGTLAGDTSPMHGTANCTALVSASQSANVDPRLGLAWCLWEGHMGSDPGLAAARVLNFGGIKWAGQAGAFDSGIAADTGGTYAGFPDVGGYFTELYRTLTNEYCGPYFNAGDLVNAASVYITGQPNSGHGAERVATWQQYVRDYPPSGGANVADGVYGEDLIVKFETQIGHPNSGTYDTLNGDHPWAYWCRAGVESTGRNCGLTVVAHPSALAAQQAAAAQGLLTTSDPPEHGAVIQLDQRFYAPDGHTGLWNANKGMMLCTVTDGTGVGYKAWGPGTIGYAGWYRLPGIVAPYRVTPPAPVVNLVIPGTPANSGITDPMKMVGVGGAFRRLFEGTPYCLQTFGFPVTNEMQAVVADADGTRHQRTVQFFERAVMVYDSAQAVPWDATILLRTQTVMPLAAQ